MRPLALRILHHHGGEEVRELVQGRLGIGRDPDNWLASLDPALSRRHAALEVGPDEVVLECLPSRNPTMLNGTRVEGRHHLVAGDQVLLGRTLLCLTRRDAALERAASQPTAELAGGSGALGRPIGDDRGFVALLEQAARVAAQELPILLLGESGTGKEVLARYIHSRSRRAGGPFVVINCPALPPSLAESELFGVESGVATGVSSRPGLLEQADGGTLLLDEVADLPPEEQAKLLRFVEGRTLTRVGGRRELRMDVRILAATNRDVEAAVAAGTMRADLYYRLAGVVLRLIPLRRRAADVPLLAGHFLASAAPGLTLSPAALDALQTHPWPGNVRQLKAIVERAAYLAAGSTIEAGDLGLESPGDAPTPGSEAAGTPARAGDAPPGQGDAQARRLLEGIHGGRLDFWTDVWAPFSRRELPRQVVAALVAEALAEGDGSVRGLAATLGVSDRYRKLLDFLRNNKLLSTET
jgi:two-component system, NtrC family, response regulator AtoC